MKKAAIAFIALALCATARSELLYWMVDEGNLGDDFRDYAYAGVAVEGTADHLYFMSEEGERFDVWPVSAGMFGSGVYADLGVYGANNRFFVELFNEDGRIAFGPSVDYESLLNAKSIVPSVGGTGQDAPNAWAVSSFSTVPVPEPTSGLLTLLGVAALALRRKRILV